MTIVCHTNKEMKRDVKTIAGKTKYHKVLSITWIFKKLWNILQISFNVEFFILGTRDNCGGQRLNSIRNLLPKRSKSLEEFPYEKNNENETRSGKMVIKRPTDGWKRIRKSLKLQKYKLPIKSGKIFYHVLLCN